MLSSEALKKIVTEARPIIERQINDALLLAGLRDAVAVEGGDWGQLKALIKAQIQDENDDAGDGKRVRKILDKAEYATAYAEMLGLAKMNEDNFSGDMPDHDPATGEITESDLAETRPDGRGKAESASGEAPDTAPQQIHESSSINDEASSTAAPQGEAVHSQGTGAETLAGREERSTGQAASADLPTNSRAFIKQLRPHCQNPDACGGQGKSHCFSCSVKIKDDPLEAA